MSFYTALTGLNGAQADISATSNNIANVGTTGFKRSRAEFGDIFATSPLQNSSSSIGSGTILKGVKQQFTQGNIASSLNALDLAISGQGFFALKPSLTSTQVVYTRNGSFNVDNNRNVVDSSGQFLLTYPVNDDGSVTAKDIDSAVPLRLPVTSGDPQATTMVDLAVNLPASAPVVTEKEKFADGYTFDPNDPESFTNSTSFTIFDDLGNPTIATVYFIKTQAATASDPTNKFDTKLVINGEVVEPDLVPAVNDKGKQIYIDQFGNQTTEVPDPSYFDTGRSAPLYKLDDIRQRVPSQPAALTGEESGFDFGDEGTRQIEIVTDPMLFGATYESNPANQGVYWGKDFLLVNVDDGTRPVSIDIRPGRYNAEELAAEVERAINEAYDDERKVEIRKGVDDRITVQLFTPTQDGDAPWATKLSVDLLSPSFVSTQAGLDVANLTAPNFDIDVFLAHAQARINDALNAELGASAPAVPNIKSNQFARLTSTTALVPPPASPQVASFDYNTRDIDVTGLSNNSGRFGIEYREGKFSVRIADANANPVGSLKFSIGGVSKTIDIGTTDTVDSILNNINSVVTAHYAGGELSSVKRYIEALSITSSNAGTTLATTFDAANDTLSISAAATGAAETLTLNLDGLNLSVALDPATASTTTAQATAIATALNADSAFSAKYTATASGGDVLLTTKKETGTLTYMLTEKRYLGYSNFGSRPDVEVFERKTDVAQDTTAINYNAEQDRLTIKLADTNGLNGGDTIKLLGIVPSAGDPAAALNGRSFTITEVDRVNNTVIIATADLGLPDESITVPLATSGDFVVLSARATDVEAFFEGANLTVDGSAASFNNQRIVLRETDAARHSYSDDDLTTDFAGKSIFGATTGATFTAEFAGLGNTNPTISALGLPDTAPEMAWVDELDPPIKVSYDAATQSIVFNVDHTALGPGGTISDVSAIQISSGRDDSVNGIGLSGTGSAAKVAITSATAVRGQPFIFDGANSGDAPDRFGAKVQYDRDTRAFTFESGTTGKEVRANKALGVTEDQQASNIQVGRYEIDPLTGRAKTGDGTIDLASRVLARGDNNVMGVGRGKNVGFVEGTGLKSQPARAVGAPAKDPLNSEPIFLNPANKETTFNVSVNGVNAIIEIPGGNYIGSTLAELLEDRINQMRDPDSGRTIGGVTVRYQPNENNFVFTTGTTGDTSTIRIKGPAKLGLEDVPLGVGSVPTIANLVQATNENGIPLYVNERGEIVDSEPDNLVADYFPLYLDEGELTFDKTGRLISPKGLTRYESQSDTFSISLDIDYSASTQLATPFAVNNLEQNGFTSGRLDGLSIDATGLLRANYTNGQNKPLGKLVLANFNNQNGLKQIGNATYVETAASGEPIIGEAGTEGFGSIQSGALERSNVDITEELVNLITAQRNFQAASKAIETSTQLTQTIINIRT